MKCKIVLFSLKGNICQNEQRAKTKTTLFRPVDLGHLRARPQPSARDSFPLVTPVDFCKEGKKGALAAVCTPTLKSASKKHQKLYTSVLEHRVWHSEGG